MSYYWGKAGTSTLGPTWLPVGDHMIDTGHVASELLKSWVPERVIETLSRHAGLNKGEFKSLVTFLAAVHDIGKITAPFQGRQLREGVRLNAQEMAQMVHPDMAHITSADTRALPHAVAGHAVFLDWLTRVMGWGVRDAQRAALIISSHHGVFPTALEVVAASESHLLGGSTWVEARDSMLDACVNVFGVREILQRGFRFPSEVTVFVSGLTVLSDWIASNESLFPLVPDGVFPEGRDSEELARSALKRLAIPSPWAPHGVSSDDHGRIRALFGYPEEATANRTQIVLNDVARACEEPELLILESPTGVGKTEAALMAAEVLAEKFGCAGVTVALPTQATTNAMYARVHAWVGALDVPDAARDVQLAHGKAKFNALHGQTAFGWGGSGGVTKNMMLSRAKLKLLSNFTVATIDQVLVAGLRVKHNSLRHLGLARKVLILDEVHAADIFMRQYLVRVLEWAGAYRVPVIALSATLPETIRGELLAAYARGKGVTALPLVGAAEFPRVTHTHVSGVHSVAIGSDIEDRNISVRIDDLTAAEVGDELKEKLASGGRALVIRNTVSSGIATFKQLNEMFPGQVRLLHARLATAHRAANDTSLLEWIGKDAIDLPGERKIVVATQVAEQSLDIDVDVLYTDVCPMDALLQRVGRVHRHTGRTRPAGLEQPSCVVMGVSGDSSDFTVDRSSARIYSHYLLATTAAQLFSRETLVVPQDVDALIHGTYEETPPLGSSLMDERVAKYGQELQELQERLARQARLARVVAPDSTGPLWSFSTAEQAESDQKVVARVRDIEETVEVVIVHNDDVMNQVLDGVSEALSHTLSIPAYVVDGQDVRSLPYPFEQAMHGSPDFEGVYFLDLRNGRQAKVGKYCLSYSRLYGLEIIRDSDV